MAALLEGSPLLPRPSDGQFRTERQDAVQLAALNKQSSPSTSSSKLTAAARPDELQNGAVELPRYPHLMTVAEVAASFGTNMSKGLTEAQVLQARLLYGFNLLAEKEGKSLWALIQEQFQDLLVRILLAAAVISFVLAILEDNGGTLSAFVEPFVILLILIANAIVSIWQENNAEKSLEALKKLQPEVARVHRNGAWMTISAEDLVPGDVIEVRVGDRVPADARLAVVESTTIKLEESQLTGEAASVCKTCDPLSLDDFDCEIQRKRNILFSSTTVSHGRGQAIVIATGMNSEIGRIQAAVVEAGEDETPSPLQAKLDEFSTQLSKVIGIICIIVWLINFNHFAVHGSFLRGCIYYFKIAVALAVAAIPEGLPAVITTCLALGTKRMANRHAIVRKLQSVETLGCTTVICSDKTGTLTTNEMSAVAFAVPDEAGRMVHYSVEGCSFEPIGSVSALEGGLGSAVAHGFDHIQSHDVGLKNFVRVCALCSDASLEYSNNKIKRSGEPTEAALKVLVEKLGCPDRSLNAKALQQRSRYSAQAFCDFWAEDYVKLATLEFSRERKSMSVLVRRRDGNQNSLLCKGAPESVLERCDSYMGPNGAVYMMDENLRATLLGEFNLMASQALRVLAMAVRIECEELADYNGSTHPAHHILTDYNNFARLERRMTFLGFAGLLDPPRPEVKHAVKMCRAAGIRVIMITGDTKLTAEAIAKECSICVTGSRSPSRRSLVSGSGMEVNSALSLTGKEFENLSLEEQLAVLRHPDGAVFSRTEPKHKQVIVKLLRSLDEVVAMTGDGVNDAPALKQADIGIAMGISGTEVAKEASAMILADDNFKTIVAAVEEGRSIYNNMKAFIRYLISSNIGEVASIFITAALGIPEGLAPVQLLWVNLVTDGLPATALGFNPPDLDVMTKRPRRKEDKLITGWVMFRYFTVGIYVGIATVGIFLHYFLFDTYASDGHSLVTYQQLSHFNTCPTWSSDEFTPNMVYGMNPNDPCSYFGVGKIKASTLSLTVLVVIEMLNAFNALSEDYSLTKMVPWSNLYLCAAAIGSILVHCLILYCSPLAAVFNVVPLSRHDWVLVVLWALPVLLLDEGLKYVARATDVSNDDGVCAHFTALARVKSAAFSRGSRWALGWRRNKDGNASSEKIQ